jgi:meiosis-specific transcription factor NDT80
MSGGPVEGLNGEHHMVEGDDAKMNEATQDYGYYPAPLYENMAAKGEHSLPLPQHRVKEEYPGPGAVASGWHNGGCGRFQGMETSRGYYPDVHTHVGY